MMSNGSRHFGAWALTIVTFVLVKINARESDYFDRLNLRDEIDCLHYE